jgi:hypothetical protein
MSRKDRPSDYAHLPSQMGFRSPTGPPLCRCNTRPHQFYQSERPRTLQETVSRAKYTRKGEQESEGTVTGFQCVANNHCCDCKKTECGKHVHGPDSVRKKLGITFGEETNMHGDGWRNTAIALIIMESTSIMASPVGLESLYLPCRAGNRRT